MIVIDARWRTAAYAGEMVRIYRDAIGIATQNLPPVQPTIMLHSGNG